MPVKVRPAPVAAVSWTGFYAGLNAGGLWSRSGDVSIATTTVFLEITQPNAAGFAEDYAAQLNGASPGSSSRGVFIGGVQIGYLWQADTMVAGFEADIQGLSKQGGSTTTVTGPVLLPPNDAFGGNLTTIVSAERSLRYFGTVRGRLGVLAAPDVLAYVTGGLAYGRVSTDISVAQLTDNPALTNAFANGSSSATRLGWTAGAGLEWLFGRVSAKVEYLYFDLGSSGGFSGQIAPLLAPPGPGTPIFINALQANGSRFSGHIARVGLNLHFN
jgi:outer membrane immunogenic protein